MGCHYPGYNHHHINNNVVLYYAFKIKIKEGKEEGRNTYLHYERIKEEEERERRCKYNSPTFFPDLTIQPSLFVTFLFLLFLCPRVP